MQFGPDSVFPCCEHWILWTFFCESLCFREIWKPVPWGRWCCARDRLSLSPCRRFWRWSGPTWSETWWRHKSTWEEIKPSNPPVLHLLEHVLDVVGELCHILGVLLNRHCSVLLALAILSPSLGARHPSLVQCPLWKGQSNYGYFFLYPSCQYLPPFLKSSVLTKILSIQSFVSSFLFIVD